MFSAIAIPINYFCLQAGGFCGSGSTRVRQLRPGVSRGPSKPAGDA